ncbi:MAG: ABC transporter permease [Mycobacterium sp.]|nr:ABC transporter permease [Mycobacterium sp.]
MNPASNETAGNPTELRTGSLTTESAVFAGRLLTRWRRDPMVPVQALLFPTVLLVVYHLLISKSMAKVMGTDNIVLVVAMCALAGAMSGSLASALTIPVERDNGLLSRFWVMPVHRISALSGTLLAEAVRTFAGTLLIVAVGMAFGLRFEGGLPAALLFVLIPVLWIVVFATVVITVAVHSENRTMLTWFATAVMGLVFGNSSVVPVKVLPSWVRPVIEFQPMSPTIATMRALSQGGPVLIPLLLTAGWLILLAAIFLPLAISGYRSASESGG